MSVKDAQEQALEDERTARARIVHVEVGRLALERGWLGYDDLRRALELVAPCPEHELVAAWVDAGFLSSAQAATLVDEALSMRRSGERARAGREDDTAAAELAEALASVLDDDVDHDHDRDPGDAAGAPDQTLGHEATLVRQRAAATAARDDAAPAPALARSTGPMPVLDPATSSIAETMLPRGVAVDRPRTPAHDAAAAAPVFDADDLALPGPAMSERYLVEEEIGRGGSGRVFRAFDRALGRTVAMKVLRVHGSLDVHDHAQRLERFVDEARGTGRLEHPNIIPIYDVGVLPDGQPYYTMKLLRRHSLRQVLRQLAAQDEATRREYRLGGLLHIFLPVCRAVAYAHARGVVHRDLKPDNIMLGDYGEVLVTDWGLARSLTSPPERFESPEGRPATLGTPAYMPPEQAMGRLEQVDELSDIYCLGAILYEILTLQPPYDGPSALFVLERVVEGRLVAPSRRAAGRHVPRTLEEICLKAMAATRDARFASALELHDEVQSFLEGQQSREASRKVYLARTASREYFRCIDELDTLDAEVKALRDSTAAWAPLEHKRPLWRAEDGLERLWTQLARAYSDAVRAFTQALAYNPNDDDARRGLADLYWSRFQQAETRKNLVDQVHYESLIRQLDREGRYNDLLEGLGTLSLTSSPPGARVTLWRIRERNRVLEPWEPEDLGPTPLQRDRLETGSYVAVLEAAGHTPVRYPVLIDRCGHWRGHVELLPGGRETDGFVYVPGGPYISGGDPGARLFEPEETVHQPSFLLAQDLVTFGEYLEFLDDLQQHDAAEAALRAPRTRDGDGVLALLGGDGRWHPAEILIEGEARLRYPAGQGHELRLPIMSIDVLDTLAYIAWRSQRDGRRYRLPTLREMEKAARGVDGRFFPWGNHFDATFCKMRLSRPEMPQPEPVGVFETDVSIYGVRDLAGTLQHWVRDESWARAAATSADPPPPPPGCLPDEHVPESCAVAGGSWNHFEQSCRAASSVRMLSVGRSVSVGIRLALDLG